MKCFCQKDFVFESVKKKNYVYPFIFYKDIYISFSRKLFLSYLYNIRFKGPCELHKNKCKHFKNSIKEINLN